MIDKNLERVLIVALIVGFLGWFLEVTSVYIVSMIIAVIIGTYLFFKKISFRKLLREIKEEGDKNDKFE